MSRRHVWPRTTGLVLATVAMAALLARSVSAQSAGTITTVAGGGPGTGPGVNASLRGNVKAIADAAGNLYVSDGFAHRVYRLDAASGVLAPLAGDGFPGYSGDGGPALQARLGNPYGLALDPAQNRLYVADVGHNVIRAVDLASGVIATVAGTGTCGYSGDNGPAASAQLCNLLSDLALDVDGTLYFATDFGGWRIRAVENGVIRTVAGNGVPRGELDGQGGDPADDYRNSVAATSASLGAVTAVAVDSAAGGLFFYEAAALAVGGARLRRVDLVTGMLTTYAGNGFVYGQIDGPGGDPADDVLGGVAALQSALGHITSMAAGPAGGDLYMAAYTVGLVQVVYSGGGGLAGTIDTVLGGGASLPLNVPPLDAGLYNPTGVSLDAAWTVYVAAGSHLGDGGGEVYAATASNIGPAVGNGWSGYCGDGGPATAACLKAPSAARADPAGSLLLADQGNQTIRSVSAGGTITSLVSLSGRDVVDVWPLAGGSFLLSDSAGHTVFRTDAPYTSLTTFAGTGTATGAIDGPGGDPRDDLGDGELAWVASLNAPAGLVQDAGGHTFIADSANHRVRRVDAVTGVITTVAGTGFAGYNGDGQPATFADLNLPYGLAFDASGDLLVSEREGHRVRRIGAGADGLVTGEPDEIVSTAAGTGTASFSGDGLDATAASLYGPTGLAVDVLGHIYIADTGSHAVRAIDRQTGVIQTIAGRGTEGDGVPAVDAQLGTPLGLSAAVLNGNGYLFVADSQQHRVRRIDLGPAQPPANQPPVVDPLGLNGAVLLATSPAGATVGLYANAVDPDGDPLTYTWSGLFGTVTGWGVTVRLPIGLNTVTVAVDDGQGHVVTESATVTVTGENTFTGNGEVVTPQDDHEPTRDGETRGRVSVTFLGPVTTPGLTWFRTRTDQNPPPPAGKQSGSAPLYYDIATTAVAAGDVRICLDLTGMSFAFPGQVELHRLQGAWTGLGVSPHPVTRVVCAQAPFAQAFGTHANFTPADPATEVVTIAGTGQAADTGDGGPAIQAGLHAPEGLALDRPRHFLYIGGGSHRVRRVNLANGQIDTIAGTGSIDEPVDGVDARLSSIGSISGLAVDADGHLFIGDKSHCLVRRVDALTNVITTVAGQWRGGGLTCGHAGDGGPATAARIGFAHRLAFDPAGNLLFAELPTLAGDDGGFIRRVAAGPDQRITGGDAAEIVTTVAGNGIQDLFVQEGIHPLDAGLYPWDLAVGAGGALYVAENNGVLRLAPGADGLVDGSPDETVTRVLGTPLGYQLPFQGDGGPARSAYAGTPGGIAVLPSGDLLVTNPSIGRIRRISAGADGVVDGSADEHIVTVAGFSSDSFLAPFNGDGYALSTTFAWPVELAIDGAAFLVADPVFHRVRRVGLSGIGGPAADLSIVASAAPDPVSAGSVLAYTATVTNGGPDTAHGVRVSLPVPATLGFVGSSPAGACTGPAPGTSGTIVCDLADLAGGAGASVTIDTRPTAAGPLAVTLTASAGEMDPNPANSSATVSVVVEQMGPVVLTVTENIVVTDVVGLVPSVWLNVSEAIVVADAVEPDPSMMIAVAETITVDDAVALDTPRPTAVAAGSATICAGASTALSGSGGVSCSWAPATGLDNASSCAPVASPSVTTTYTLTVTDGAGQASTNAPTVTVTVSPAPTAVASGTATITAGQAAPLSGSGGDSCLWSPATGLDDPASCTPSASPAVTTTYALSVASGAGCTSSNNATVTITVIQSRRRPNLKISALTAPGGALPGATISVTDTTVNASSNSGLAFPGSTTRLYLSADAVLDPADTVLGQRPLLPLGPGAADTATTQVTIPGQALGTYWIIAKADADDVVPETRERDNARSTRIEVGPPDLLEAALRVPRFVRAGVSFDVRDTVENHGAVGAGPTTTRFYLSFDSTFDAADTLLGSRSVPALGPGGVSDATTPVVILAGTTLRTYFLIAVADADGAVAELDEGNNRRSRSVTVR